MIQSHTHVLYLAIDLSRGTIFLPVQPYYALQLKDKVWTKSQKFWQISSELTQESLAQCIEKGIHEDNFVYSVNI